MKNSDKDDKSRLILELSELDYKRAISFARKLMRYYPKTPYSSAEDILHETYVAILEGRRKQPIGVSTIRFVLRAMGSIVLNASQKKENHTERYCESVRAHNNTPERYCLDIEYQDQLLKKISRLDNREIQLFAYLVLIQGIHKPQELASLMLIDVSKAYNLKKKLKKIFLPHT